MKLKIPTLIFALSSSYLQASVTNYDFDSGFDAIGTGWGTQNPRTGSGGAPSNAGAYITADYVANNAGGISYNYNSGFGPSTSLSSPILPTGLVNRTNIYFGGDNTGIIGGSNPGQQAVSVKINSTFDLTAGSGRLSLKGSFFNTTLDTTGQVQQAQYNESYLWFGNEFSGPILGDPVNAVTGTGFIMGMGSALVWRNDEGATTGSPLSQYGGRPSASTNAWCDFRMGLYISGGSLWGTSEYSTNNGLTWTFFGPSAGANATNLGAIAGTTFGGYLDLTQLKLGSAVDGWADGLVVATGDDVAIPPNLVPETSSLLLVAATFGYALFSRRRTMIN